jgi:hypothetical protein
MRSKLLLGTAVLLAGVGLAAAQNMPGGGGQSAPAQQHQGAQSQGAQGGAAGQERGRSGQAQERTQERSKGGQTTGQAPQREQGMERRGAEKEKSQEKAQPRRGAEEKAQPQRSQRDRDHTTGQSPGQTQPGQTQQRQQTQPQQGEMQRGQQTQPSQGQAAQQGRSGDNVSLTTEQRTQIRQSVLAGSNVPRANNVNFALSVGTAVPTSVHVVEVPTVLVNIHPQWRGFYYFVVGDQIIIVDRGHKIVAVLAV